MRILVLTPVQTGWAGNRVTAERWATHLRALGHRVRLDRDDDARAVDLVIALHARKTAAAVRRVRRRRASVPVVVALTGTDVYRDLATSRPAQAAVAAAWRLVVLQPLAGRALGRRHRAKVRVIHQSLPRRGRRPPRQDAFEVCVLGHLRAVKDPFRAALAARGMPASSRLRVRHLGRAMTPAMAARAEREMAVNPRYTWDGERPRATALQVLARSRLLVISSKLEGGANVVTEALACTTPVLASRIDGNVGLLGEDYLGYFPVGDTRALTRLLRRAEEEPGFLRDLGRQLRMRAALVTPSRERAAWRDLLSELPDDVT